MICDKCQNRVPKDAKFCPTCGNEISRINENQALSRKAKDAEAQQSVQVIMLHDAGKNGLADARAYIENNGYQNDNSASLSDSSISYHAKTRYGVAELVFYLNGMDLLIFGNGLGLRFVKKHLSKAPMEETLVHEIKNKELASLLMMRGYGKQWKKLYTDPHWINTSIIGISIMMILFRASSTDTPRQSSAVIIVAFVLIPAICFRIVVYLRARNAYKSSGAGGTVIAMKTEHQGIKQVIIWVLFSILLVILFLAQLHI